VLGFIFLLLPLELLPFCYPSALPALVAGVAHGVPLGMRRILPEYLYADLSNRSMADDDVLVREEPDDEEDDEDDIEEEENDEEDDDSGYSE
jgi:hypothetical protein